MTLKILFISNKEWGRKTFRFFRAHTKHHCDFLNSKSKIINKIKNQNYDYVFVLHWSYKIPSHLLKYSKIIGFHSSDLPNFSGGSPIQNQIIKGLNKTKMTAFLISEEFDKGPIILKRRLSLKGTLSDILNRCSDVSIDIIKNIINKKKLIYRSQNYKSTPLKRLSYQDNNLKLYKGLNKVYDAIRMVDSEEYKKAYVILENKLKLEFSKAKKKTKSILCEVKITTKK